MNPIENTIASKLAAPASICVNKVNQKRQNNLLRGMDLAAMLLLLLGLFLAICAVGVFGALALVKSISGQWANPLVCWLTVAVGLALVWVAGRWKKS